VGDGAEVKEGVPQERTDRPLRADAQRNLDALLTAAMAVFARSGVDAPTREIAEEAGVGVGTLYRHFPGRSDLIVAVYRHEVDACADAAASLAAQHAPGEALRLWIERYTDFVGAKRGLAAALNSGDPAYNVLPGYFGTRLRPAVEALLAAATRAGDVRADIEASDLLFGVASLTAASRTRDPAQTRRMIALFLDGLRFGAERPAAPSPLP
jgi:AcrR family transcriptional regulator